MFGDGFAVLYPPHRFFFFCVCNRRKGMGTRTPLLKVGDEAFDGKAEPIIGTTLTFTTPPAGSSGRHNQTRVDEGRKCLTLLSR